jgi:hypothetical protein
VLLLLLLVLLLLPLLYSHWDVEGLRPAAESRAG